MNHSYTTLQEGRMIEKKHLQMLYKLRILVLLEMSGDISSKTYMYIRSH